jgi:hypothetical protein
MRSVRPALYAGITTTTFSFCMAPRYCSVDARPPAIEISRT